MTRKRKYYPSPKFKPHGLKGKKHGWVGPPLCKKCGRGLFSLYSTKVGYCQRCDPNPTEIHFLKSRAGLERIRRPENIPPQEWATKRMKQARAAALERGNWPKRKQSFSGWINPLISRWERGEDQHSPWVEERLIAQGKMKYNPAPWTISKKKARKMWEEWNP